MASPRHPVAAALARNIGALRARAGISQEELGFRAALHRTEVSQLERGVRLARMDTLVRLAGALGVSPGELLAGVAWHAPEAARGHYYGAAAKDAPAPPAR